jgi:hypothetical protein
VDAGRVFGARQKGSLVASFISGTSEIHAIKSANLAPEFVDATTETTSGTYKGMGIKVLGETYNNASPAMTRPRNVARMVCIKY